MSTDTHFPRHPSISTRFLRILEKSKPYAIYLPALIIFAVSRAVVVAGINFGALLAPSPDSIKWGLGHSWFDRLLRYDAGYYISIAQDGYRHSTDPAVLNSTAFYPLYPLLGRFVHWSTGADTGVALLIVSNISAVAACLLLTKFVRDEAGDEIALWTTAFFWFFPSTFFLSAGYTESLCLTLILLSFVVLKQEKFILASLFAGLAVATRSTGIVMLPVILWELYQRPTSPWPQTFLKMFLCSLLAVSGLIAFMIFLGIEFGDPLAFAHSQSAWHQGTFTSRFVDAVMLVPLRHGGWLLPFLALTAWSFWHLRFAVSLYALATLMLPYLTLGVTHSMSRFVLMCFPAFMCLALLCKTRPLLASLILAAFGAILFRQSALFSQLYFVG
ncbi:mannosyltransferase family protein [Hyphomicrobium sp.]|jgi:hypothetical protein|uniref:mannosyltransferase family protein n=1 Tax=Hyphomicrobium sp. TaxID=82 RepID=UPI003568485E